MESIAVAVEAASASIVDGLESKGWALYDGLLDAQTCRDMRAEAVALYVKDYYAVSQSTRWDSESNRSITYDKRNVYSMQLNGGEQYYVAPKLHQDMVQITRTLQPILSQHFPEAMLSSTMMANKLAVCTGDGSAYDKHYDNSGMEDTRKVTVLYYMNDWRPEMEGQFRIYQSASTASAASSESTATVDINPVGNRLLVFWSDQLVHSVQASCAPRGKLDHRYALTLWLTCISPDGIVRDDAEALKHFGSL
jgi:Rps23 Pro-64 3,4-dihydroxylase Tpa1-like proline 4-hydroxylase